MTGLDLKMARKRLLSFGVMAVAFLAIVFFAWLDFRDYQSELLTTSSSMKLSPSIEAEFRVQSHIAGFTYGLLLVSALGFLVSIGALIFLGFTLNETRAMAIETRRMVDQARDDAAEARSLLATQHRAYVRAVDATLLVKGVTLHLKIHYKNDGDTPALDVHHRVVVAVRDLDGIVSDTVVGLQSKFDPKRPIPPKSDDETHCEVEPAKVAAQVAGQMPNRTVTFIGAIIYRDTFGSWIKTEFEFFLPVRFVQQVAERPLNELPSNGFRLEWGKRSPGGVYQRMPVPPSLDELNQKSSQ